MYHEHGDTPNDCAGGYLLPYPVSGSQALLERLEDILSRERIDAIIPSLDAELPNFIDLEPTLARRGVRTLLPSRAQLHSRDKDRLAALCAQAGVATPRVRPISDVRFFDRCTSPEEGGWTWPLVVKGVFYGSDQDTCKFLQARPATSYSPTSRRSRCTISSEA